MSPDTGVRELVQTALNDFDQSSSVSASVRRALRIAALRRDYVNQLWLQMELTDLSVNYEDKRRDPAIARIQSQLETLFGAEEGKRQGFPALIQFERNRSVGDGNGNIIGHSVGQLEQGLAMTHQVYSDLTVPENLTPIDTYFYAKEMDSSKAKMLPDLQLREQMLERIKNAVYVFLVSTESELDQGQPKSSIFLRAQDSINSAMTRFAPEALEKFVAAQDRLYSGAPEDLAHALTSCRRMIKALADALYPPTGASITGVDGVDRKMSDEAYRNRLLQYVREELGKHAHGNALQKTIDTLGARLTSLDSLASKGVHDNVSAAEAETCVVWTYLLAADIVRIADGSSPLLLTTSDGKTPSA